MSEPNSTVLKDAIDYLRSEFREEEKRLEELRREHSMRVKEMNAELDRIQHAIIGKRKEFDEIVSAGNVAIAELADRRRALEGNLKGAAR